MHLSALHIYPVKSCRGLSLPASELDDHGLVNDRRFMVVSAADGMFLTQRSHPRMALIETTLNLDTLTLSSPNHDSVTIPTQAETGNLKSEMPVTVWKNTVIADDCGDKSAEWLSRFLGLPLRLVRIGDAYQRPVKPSKAQPGDEVSFADAFPFIVIGEASLADLNSRLTEPLPMNRFRPSLVVAGSAPYDEDAWTRFKIGNITFRNTGPCARCAVTTTNQLTAERGKEPLRTFATFRRDPEDSTKVNFGSNLIHETKRGALRIGDPVVLS